MCDAISDASPKGHSIPKAQPAEAWAFVNVSEPKQSKDNSLRKLVRSNAMRDYRQKKKQSQGRSQKQIGNTPARHQVSDSSHSRTPTLPIVTRNGDDGGCCICRGHTKCEHDCRCPSITVRSSPKQLLGGGGTDPFDALPNGADRRHNGLLLNHCEPPSHSSLERS